MLTHDDLLHLIDLLTEARDALPPEAFGGPVYVPIVVAYEMLRLKLEGGQS